MENQTANDEKEMKKKVDAQKMDEAEAEAEMETIETEADLEEEAQVTDEYKEKYFYLAAEMQNMQKRFDREKQNLIKYGNENILRDLLEVVDNFERTVGALKEDKDEKMQNVVIGIDMIAKQFMDTLAKFGLEKVKTEGEIFDPNFHEALAQVPAPGKKDMEIVQVHQNGYKLNDRLIRPSKVVVAKNEN